MAKIKFKDIEAFYRTDWKELLSTFHLKDRLSSFEIAERIQQDVGIEYTSRAIRKWLKKFGILRSHEEALKNRVLTGRMDYSQRKLDYFGRFIDYAARDRARGYLWGIGLKGLLRKKGDTIRLARTVGVGLGLVCSWKYLRHRVSVEYQERICAYFGIDRLRIFSEVKTTDFPKQGSYGISNQSKRLVKNGYLYAPGLKETMYAKGISIQDLCDRLNKPQASVSGWLAGRLVSPVDQERIKRILGDPCDKVFSKRR